MEANPILFRDLTYIFLAAVFGGLVAWRLRLPLILGFILGGIAISPFTPGPHLSDVHTFEVFAEVGVVLLMFSIGVEFSIPDLLRVKWVALLGAPIGILLMVGIAAAAASSWDGALQKEPSSVRRSRWRAQWYSLACLATLESLLPLMAA